MNESNPNLRRKPRVIRGLGGGCGITVFPGSGSAQHGSYAEVRTRLSKGTLNRRQMRDLRDALNAALGEAAWPWLGKPE